MIDLFFKESFGSAFKGFRPDLLFYLIWILTLIYSFDERNIDLSERSNLAFDIYERSSIFDGLLTSQRLHWISSYVVILYFSLLFKAIIYNVLHSLSTYFAFRLNVIVSVKSLIVCRMSTEKKIYIYITSPPLLLFKHMWSIIF